MLPFSLYLSLCNRAPFTHEEKSADKGRRIADVTGEKKVPVPSVDKDGYGELTDGEMVAMGKTTEEKLGGTGLLPPPPLRLPLPGLRRI